MIRGSSRVARRTAEAGSRERVTPPRASAAPRSSARRGPVGEENRARRRRCVPWSGEDSGGSGRGRAAPLASSAAWRTLAIALGAERGRSWSNFSQFAEDAAAYGYWAVLLVVAGDGVFPLLPGETAIVAAAVLAADGALSLPLVILAGAVGRRHRRLGRLLDRPRGRRADQALRHALRGRRAAPGRRADGAAPGPGPGRRRPVPARHPHRDQPLLRRRADGLPALPVLRPARRAPSGPPRRRCSATSPARRSPASSGWRSSWPSA